MLKKHRLRLANRNAKKTKTIEHHGGRGSHTGHFNNGRFSDPGNLLKIRHYWPVQDPLSPWQPLIFVFFAFLLANRNFLACNSNYLFNIPPNQKHCHSLFHFLHHQNHPHIFHIFIFIVNSILWYIKYKSLVGLLSIFSQFRIFSINNSYSSACVLHFFLNFVKITRPY